MLTGARYEVPTPPQDPGPRNWQSLITSVVVHGAVILLLISQGANRKPVAEAPGEESRPVAIDPAIPYQEQPRESPDEAPEDFTPLGPDAERPVPVPVEQGPAPEEVSDDDPPEQAEPAREPTEQPSQDPEGTQSSRIEPPTEVAASTGLLGAPNSPFPNNSSDPLAPPPRGTPVAGAGSMGRSGLSNTDSRQWRPSSPEAAGECVEIDLGRNADGSPVLASVIGRVLDPTGRPLAGAHLQIVGAGYATFSDNNGNYRLEFDPRLLEKCRVHVVRVTLTGFKGQTLTLGIGRRVQSDDVRLRRN